MLPFVILLFDWGSLSLEFAVDRLFMFNKRLIGLLILCILVEDLYILTGAPCPLIIQKAIYVSSFQFGFISSG